MSGLLGRTEALKHRADDPLTPQEANIPDSPSVQLRTGPPNAWSRGGAGERHLAASASRWRCGGLSRVVGRPATAINGPPCAHTANVNDEGGQAARAARLACAPVRRPRSPALIERLRRADPRSAGSFRAPRGARWRKRHLQPSPEARMNICFGLHGKPPPIHPTGMGPTKKRAKPRNKDGEGMDDTIQSLHAPHGLHHYYSL